MLSSHSKSLNLTQLISEAKQEFLDNVRSEDNNERQTNGGKKSFVGVKESPDRCRVSGMSEESPGKTRTTGH